VTDSEAPDSRRGGRRRRRRQAASIDSETIMTRMPVTSLSQVVLLEFRFTEVQDGISPAAPAGAVALARARPQGGRRRWLRRVATVCHTDSDSDSDRDGGGHPPLESRRRPPGQGIMILTCDSAGPSPSHW
jgi:hypothetical protein